MPGKVLHISDGLHARIRAYCTKKGVRISDWAEEAVSRVFVHYLKEETPVMKVKKRRLQPLVKEDSHDRPRPWELAPFWERRGYRFPQEDEEREDHQLEAGGDRSGDRGGDPLEEAQCDELLWGRVGESGEA
jgi:hypothetical protein